MENMLGQKKGNNKKMNKKATRLALEESKKIRRQRREKFLSGEENPKVSIIIPAMNEEKNLPWTLKQIPANIYEVILIDGNSTDNTVAVAEENYPGIKVIHQLARGKGSALATGLLNATGDILIMMDADGSMDPIEIHVLKGALLSGADVVKASRYTAGGGSHDISVLRDFGNRGLTIASKILFRHSWSELCYGLAGFWADIIPDLHLEHIIHDGDPDDKYRYGRGFEIETLLFTRAYRLGLVVVEVPSFEYPRMHGESNLQTFPDGWRVLNSMIRERFGIPPHARKEAVLQRWEGNPSVDIESPKEIEPVAVVICAHDSRRWERMKAAVESVQKQTQKADAIFLVIDHNTELMNRAHEEFGDSVILLENIHSRGLSGARNTAIRSLPKDIRIVAFLDDDATPESGWLQKITEPLQPGAASNIMITSGWADPDWPTQQPSWFPNTFRWVVGCTWQGVPTAISEIRNPIGATMAFRREVFTEVGVFIEGMGRVGSHSATGCEETELAIRLHQNNPQAIVLHVPEAKVQHAIDADRVSWKYFARRCRAEGNSKALVTRRVGSKDGLSSEKSHIKLLLAQAGRDVMTGNPKRGAAATAGLGLTALGYAEGKIKNWGATRRERTAARRAYSIGEMP